MELAILAQNIDSLSLALVVQGNILHQRMVSGSPEQYLKLIDETLHEWGTVLSELSGVFIVTGPGSFTSSRVSTTIANTLAFALSIPVTAVENPDHLSLEELLRSTTIDRVTAPFALPSYNRPANITYPKAGPAS